MAILASFYGPLWQIHFISEPQTGILRPLIKRRHCVEGENYLLLMFGSDLVRIIIRLAGSSPLSWPLLGTVLSITPTLGQCSVMSTVTDQNDFCLQNILTILSLTLNKNILKWKSDVLCGLGIVPVRKYSIFSLSGRKYKNEMKIL